MHVEIIRPSSEAVLVIPGVVVVVALALAAVGICEFTSFLITSFTAPWGL